MTGVFVGDDVGELVGADGDDDGVEVGLGTVGNSDGESEGIDVGREEGELVLGAVGLSVGNLIKFWSKFH